MAKKTGLGRGYEALLSDNFTEENAVVTVRISEITPNKDQPRKFFDQEALDDLSENIKQYGLLQPIVVRTLPSGGYQIVAGERRFRACMQAKLVEIPVVIKELTDGQTAEIALIENLQREDLNAIEEANGYKTLMQNFGLTQEEVANRVNKSRSAVANTLRLLELGKYTSLVEDGTISAGHARALLSLKSDSLRNFAVELIKKGASVRQIEKLKSSPDKEKSETVKKVKNVYFREVESSLSEHLGRKVKVEGDDKKGKLVLDFYSSEDLKNLIDKMFNEK